MLQFLLDLVSSKGHCRKCCRRCVCSIVSGGGAHAFSISAEPNCFTFIKARVSPHLRPMQALLVAREPHHGPAAFKAAMGVAMRVHTSLFTLALDNHDAAEGTRASIPHKTHMHCMGTCKQVAVQSDILGWANVPEYAIPASLQLRACADIHAQMSCRLQREEATALQNAHA